MPIVAMPDGAQVSFPDDMPADQIRSMIVQKFPDAAQTAQPSAQPSSYMDALKAIPRSALAGILDATSGPPVPDSPVPIAPELMQGAGPQMKALEDMGGPSYQAQTPLGKIVAGGVRTATNPLSYVGPGGPALKAVGALLSGAGGEAAGLATEGTPYEIPARIAGGLAGGFAGVKTLGASAEKAAIPTAPELKASEDTLYTAARNSGLEVAPAKLADKAAQWEQLLTTSPKYAFTRGEKSAPGTLGILDELQNPPEGAATTASNLDTIRRQINNIAGETKDFKPTPDAKAAMVLKREFDSYLENMPADHVVAGNPESYVSAIKEANDTHAALSRLTTADARLQKSENQTNRQIAGSLDARIKANIGSLLDNPKSLRGYNQAEKDQIQLINDGTLTSNVMRQLGRGGAGVVPIMAQAAAGGPLAAATGGASILPQLGLMGALYGARKGAERMTVSRANELADMLAKRSPLYQQRLKALPPTYLGGNNAQLARGAFGGLLGGLR